MFVNFHTFTPPSSFIRYFIHSFSNIFSLISPSKQLDVIKIAENPLKTKKKTMPSAPTEILSYESRTSIGDKIRKEGVFEVNSLLYFFTRHCISTGGGQSVLLHTFASQLNC